MSLAVIPAEAGIQWFQVVLDPRFHGDDELGKRKLLLQHSVKSESPAGIPAGDLLCPSFVVGPF